MEELFEELVFTTFHIICFVFAVGFLLFQVASRITALQYVEKNINSKYNVWENKDEFISQQNLLDMSSVLYAIGDIPKEIKIKIGNYEVKNEDRKKLSQDNDASAVLANLNTSFSYEVEHIVNQRGELTEIHFIPVY